MNQQPTRRTIEAPGVEPDTMVTEEWASLDSYEATTNAKGQVQFHVKLYLPSDADPGTTGLAIATRLDSLRKYVKALDFTIAGDS